MVRLLIVSVAVFTLVAAVSQPIAVGPNALVREDVAPAAGTDKTLDELLARAARVRDGFDAAERLYTEIASPIRNALALRGADSTLATTITRALIRHANENNLDPALLTAVLFVENPWLVPDTTSFVGAIGLMQVMPQHAGNWGCGSDDLFDIEVNICHGARILAHNLRQTNGDLWAALLRYNGCVTGRNTPDCYRYPTWVSKRLASVGRTIAIVNS